MQEYRYEHHYAQVRSNQKRTCYRYTIEECVQEQANECRCPSDRRDWVCFLSEMKVRRDCVLREMDRQIATQYKDGGKTATTSKGFREELDDGDREHEARAEAQQVFDDAELKYRTPSNCESPDNIAQGRDQCIHERVRHETVNTHACCGLDPPKPRRADVAASRQHRDQDGRPLRSAHRP